MKTKRRRNQDFALKVLYALDGRPFGKKEKEVVDLANAAPKLLRACKVALHVLLCLSEDVPDLVLWDEGGEGYEAVCALKAAISKAEGGAA